MSDMNILTGEPISRNTSFNWTWFVELATCSCLTLFFLFYFNRLFATLVSYGIRAWTWHKYRAWIDIQALQLSFLAGRIFFKGIRYHAENETVLIQSGYITWRYWQSSSRQVDLSSPGNDGHGTTTEEEKGLPMPESDKSEEPLKDPELGRHKQRDIADARISIVIYGLEWFIYNRTPVYESIVQDALIQKTNQDSSDSQNTGQKWQNRLPKLHMRRDTEDLQAGNETTGDNAAESPLFEKRETLSPIEDIPVPVVRVNTSISVASADSAQDVPSFYSWILRVLPIAVECSKGAISLGNEHTRALVVTTFSSAKGHIEAAASGQSDFFRQVFDFDIDKPKVEMRPNPDFRRSQHVAAERIISAAESIRHVPRWWHVNLGMRHRLDRLARGIRRLFPGSSKGSLKTTASHEDYSSKLYAYDEFQEDNRSWHGLGRYMDDDERDDHEGWTHIDYARFSQLLDSPGIHFKFFWDMPGRVTVEQAERAAQIHVDDINMSEPPAYGMELIVRGGQVNYGPWSDRLRMELQTAFLPNPYRSVTPATVVNVGETRQYTVMTIRVDLEDEVSLRVPFKERSKDWQWRNRAHTLTEAAAVRKQREKRHFRFRRSAKTKLGPDVRPFGWLTVCAGQNSCVHYDMDMMPRSLGYRNLLTLDLKDTKAVSSVNHALLWRCPSQKVSSDLSNPLTWNGLHTWIFDVQSDDMEMFILRDHMIMLTDLVSDFTAGQKPDYMTFVPFLYRLHLAFPNLKLYLNANDYNIIDSPNDLEENAFLILGFESLIGDVDIPMQYFSPRQSSVGFVGEGHNAFLQLTTPVWNTLNTLAEDTTMMTLKQLNLEGSYNYYPNISPKLTDSLFMIITGYAPKFFLHGYLIRYFMNVKENYFGEDLHFRTLEEYQDMLAGTEPQGPRPGSKKENDLDVILTVRADKAAVLMPANIYSRRENLRVDILLVEADMRFTNYYMDLQVATSPLEASTESITLQDGRTSSDITSCQLFIDGAAVYGHRLFGAPPLEPTYACHWDMNVGEIIGECTSNFIRTLMHAVMAFIYTLDDDENSLPPLNRTAVHDVTFVRANLVGLHLWLVAGNTAYLAELSETDISFGDWANSSFAKELRASIPRVAVAAIDYKGALRHRNHTSTPVETLAFFETSLQLGTLDKTDNLAQMRALQQHHIRYHDQRTNRAEWLLNSQKHYPSNHKIPEWAREVPAMPMPSMPTPIGAAEKTNLPLRSDRFGRKKIQRNHSFLSISSLREQVSIPLTERKPAHRRTTFSQTVASHRSDHDHSEPEYHIKAQDRQGHQAQVTFSSAWAPPHFTLRDVQPDTTNLPRTPSNRDGDLPSLQHYPNESAEPTTDDFQGTPHDGVVLMVQNGLTGFCSPSLFISLGNLVRELGVDQAVDQLDKVQISVMKRILETHKHDDKGHIMDFALRVPFAHIRLINSSTMPGDLNSTCVDQYDVKLMGTHLMYRVLHPKAVRSGINVPHSQIAYGAIRGLSMSVSSDKYAVDRPPAHAAVSLANLGVWLSMKEEINSKLQLSNFDIILQAEQLKSMAAIIQRTVTMVDRMSNAFEGLDQSLKSRHLIYHLTQAGLAIADPAFLTRPSYVLRSADNHVRLSDSWKIVSRLRNIFATVERDKGQKVLQDCGCTDLELKDPAKREVLSSFEQWRGWDYPQDKMLIMSTLFDTPGMRTPEATFGNLVLHSEIVIGKLGLIQDPGPRQSDLAVQGLDFNIILRRGRTSGLDNNTQSIVLQAYTADTSLHLHWALIELARQVIELGNPLAMGNSQSTTVKDKIHNISSNPKSEFTVVVGSDAASIHLATVNLKLKWAAENFRSAFSFSEGGQGAMVSAFTIAANTVMAKIKDRTRTLMLWRIRMPKLYGSIWPQTIPSSDKKTMVVQLGAASNKIRFQMKQDIAKMLSVVDTVIQEEVSTVTRVVEQFRLNIDSMKPKQPTQSRVDLDLELRLALFLDDYRLNFAVLPTLQYAIAGKVARTSIIPRRNGGLDISFDIKEHDHLFEVSQGRSTDDLPLLTMPPINGHLSVVSTAALVLVRARLTIEQINLKASGVRACFDALNQPGVVQLVPDIRNAVQQIKGSVEKVTNRMATPQKAQQAKTALLLRYAIHGTLAGIKIHFSAPAIRDSLQYRADMELVLRATTLFLHNETDEPDSIHEQPQFVLNTRGIGVDLFRSTKHGAENFGAFFVGMKATGKTETLGNAGKVQVYRAWSDGLTVELYEETAILAVDIIAFLQDRIKSMKLADREGNIQHIRRMTTAGLSDRLKPKEQPVDNDGGTTDSSDGTATVLYDSTYALDVNDIMVRWNLTTSAVMSPSHELEDLVFSIRKVDLKTRQEGTARLSISDTQLQMVPRSQANTPIIRTANSALLPEVIFGTAYLTTKYERRLAFQAKGKALDLRLASDFIIPGHALQKSFGNASGELRNVKSFYESSPSTPQAATVDLLGGKRLASLLVDADFAGAVVHISPRAEIDQRSSAFGFLKGPKRSRAGRYGQAVQGEDVSSAVLQAPGVALKVEYKDDNKQDPSLSTEVRVAASSNTLYPTVVPLIQEISASIKEIMGADQPAEATESPPAETRSFISDAALNNPNPDAIFGRCKLNAGLYIQQQEFSLSCQPIARVAATAKFADIFVRVNTVSAPDQERFFAILTTFNKLEASVQHVYSRESTASFEVDSIVMSLMNSKHVSSTTGISAILNISPMKTDINAKQLQDFLLFRTIWYPPELRGRSRPPTATTSPQEQQAYAMARYKELSGKGTLPWHAIVSIQELQLQVDFGQGLGKSVFTISKLWASSRKNSDSEQNLCVGFERVGVDSTGRMSGFVELENLRARTSINWPEDAAAKTRAPFVQASIGFEHFRVKTAFDYQPFAVADISTFHFMMYNVRQGYENDSDRLVGIVDGGKVQVFCTTGTAAQGLALVQAFERLIQEKQEAYQTSLRDLDKFLRRKSMFPTSNWTAPAPSRQHREEGVSRRGTFALHTDVVVTLGALDAGVFPNTFFDNQILKVAASDVQARFAVTTTDGKTHSGLGMTLGQLRVALSSVNRGTTKALSEVSVPDVIDRATSSRGGTIVKVPRLVSSMQTWQLADSNIIEYTFRSTFEGKVDVGWNYARISFIRGMWQTHSRALAQRLGKPLPPSAIKVTAEPAPSSSSGDGSDAAGGKITAVVNVPQSKFTYVPLEPPIIDTPQLRDMGEATPPLEWIGLHRDKLPEATHSIAIVSLLEVAREIEDAYGRVLGAS